MVSGRALVTGASDRLGRAMALQLADMGLDVVVHYSLSADAAAKTVRLITAKGRKAVALQADFLDMDAVEGLVPAAALALGGPLSVLVNNASIFEHDTIKTATRGSWNRHMSSNFQAPFVLTQAFARQAPEVGEDAHGEPIARAVIINMIDQRVRKLTPEFMTYTLAKMGLWALTQTSAQALAPAIRVNAIGPGPTVQGSRQSTDHFTKQRAATLLERGSNPEDITAALAYIVNSPALTGQLLCVDGGQHLGWKTPDVLGVE